MSQPERTERRPRLSPGVLAGAALSFLIALAAAGNPSPGAAPPGPPPAVASPSVLPPSVPPMGAAPPAAEMPAPPAPECRAESAVLVDAATGSVLWEKNSRTQRPVASTTKIMTALMVLERARLEDRISFSEHARATPYANVNAKPGELFPIRDLLYAIMLRSSNDACVAVAEHLSGKAWKFAYAMTARARELGARDTSFVTTNGLYHPQHYSTAADLALLTRAAFAHPEFNEVVRTRSRAFSRSLNRKDTLIRNHNRLLERYDGADGVKTGYVRQSGRCLVASSTRSEGGLPWRLISVVLNSPDTYGDSARLMDWGRRHFQPVFFARRGEVLAAAEVRDGAARSVSLVAAQDLSAVVRRGGGMIREREVRAPARLRAPVLPDRPVGSVVALVAGRPAGEVDLLPAGPVAPLGFAGLMPATGGSLALALLVLGPRYARAIAKGARRRRRGFQARRRSPDLEREGIG